MPTPLALPCIFCKQDTQDSIVFRHQTPATLIGKADAEIYRYPICKHCYTLVAPFVLLPMHFILRESLFGGKEPEKSEVLGD